MRLSILLILLINSSLNVLGIEKKEFYDALKGDSIEQVENLILRYEGVENPTAETLVYKGALYVKKAGYTNSLNLKLDFFKRGRALIEQEVEKDPKNVEFRFVRLIVQEKVPTFLRYHQNKEEDVRMVVEGVSLLEKDVQNAIFDYATKSSSLSFD